MLFSATAVTYRYLQFNPAQHTLSSGLYLAATQEADRYRAPETAYRLNDDTKEGRGKVQLYEGPYHALSLFEWVEEARQEVVTWLRENL